MGLGLDAWEEEMEPLVRASIRRLKSSESSTKEGGEVTKLEGWGGWGG